MKLLLLALVLFFDFSLQFTLPGFDTSPIGFDQDYNLRDLVAITNVRNKLSDSVRELVRFYEDLGVITATEFVQKYVACSKLRDVRFFVVNQGEERFSATNCSQWIALFEMLRINQVFLGDYLTNSAVSIVNRTRSGKPEEIQTRSEVFIIGQYENIPNECLLKGYRQLSPVNGTFVHKAQVTINWVQERTMENHDDDRDDRDSRGDGDSRDERLNKEWKIVQFRQLLFQRWRWQNRPWSDEQFLFSGSQQPTCD